MRYLAKRPFFQETWKELALALLFDADKVEVGEWQSQRDLDSPFTTTIELQGVSFDYEMPGGVFYLKDDVLPNLPWAEDHFKERVSGQPLNPPPSHEYWPFAQKSNDQHRAQEIFSHTYPERMWPKMANEGETRPNGRQVFVPHNGVRYEYGDLLDMLRLLDRSPHTRQAFLPIWFPEDTGAVDDQRVPCTLGYHFMIRRQCLHMTYYMRSCDFMRHFRDDVYMAVRLAQWVESQLGMDLRLGTFTMHIASLHIFEGADPIVLRKQLDETN